MKKTEKVRIVKLKSSGAEVFLHSCLFCDKFASFGFEVSLRKNKLGLWYCREHKHLYKKKDNLL